MNLLFLGDIVGRAGRDVVTRLVPQLRGELALDAVICNVDNAAGGFGVTKEVTKQLLACGIDVLTTGDHLWDQKGIEALLENEPRLLRPHNFPPETPGTGLREFTLKSGKKLLVLHLLGQVFHKENLDSPFRCAQAALASYKIGHNIDAIVVDMHAEATSEKNAMGVFLDGHVSAVVGSHTHVPTADERILKAGTAYQTDTGMCGDYHNTIIGFQPEAPLQQFWGKRRKIKMEPGKAAGELRGLFVQTDDATGLAIKVERVTRS
jgi:metallophosphoesterase (TIGR00282 family)